MLLKIKSAISMLTCGCVVCMASSPSSVGFVVTRGEAHVGAAVVQGNSTLFQGDLVQSGNATSDLMFRDGSNLLLQPDSAVTVYRGYAVLQSGSATRRGNQEYAIFANGLKVSSLSAQGAVLVGLKDARHLEVMAQGGPAEVRNASGVLVAHLETGKAFSFVMQAAPQDAVPAAPAIPQVVPPTGTAPSQPAAGTQLTLHGIVRKDHAGRYGHFLLTDLATNVTYELQGSGLDDLVGGSVEATGSIIDTPPAGGAAKVLSVSDIHQMPLSEINGSNSATAPAGVPTPSGDTAPSSTEGPEVGATPEAKAPVEVDNTPPPPPPLARSQRHGEDHPHRGPRGRGRRRCRSRSGWRQILNGQPGIGWFASSTFELWAAAAMARTRIGHAPTAGRENG